MEGLDLLVGRRLAVRLAGHGKAVAVPAAALAALAAALAPIQPANTLGLRKMEVIRTPSSTAPRSA